MYSDAGYRGFGANGFKRHGTSATGAVSYIAVVIQEDTVLTEYKEKNQQGEETDMLSTRGLSAITLKQGAFLAPPMGHTISAVTASSGSYIGYNK